MSEYSRRWLSNQFERIHQKLDHLIQKHQTIYEKENPMDPETPPEPTPVPDEPEPEDAPEA